MIKTLPH